MPEVWKTIPGLKVVSLLLYRGHATDKTKVLLEAVAKIVDPKTLEEVAKDLAVFGLAFVKDGKRVPAQKVMKNMDIEVSQ